MNLTGLPSTIERADAHCTSEGIKAVGSSFKLLPMLVRLLRNSGRTFNTLLLVSLVTLFALFPRLGLADPESAFKTFVEESVGECPPPCNVIGAVLIGEFWPSESEATASIDDLVLQIDQLQATTDTILDELRDLRASWDARYIENRGVVAREETIQAITNMRLNYLPLLGVVEQTVGTDDFDDSYLAADTYIDGEIADLNDISITIRNLTAIAGEPTFPNVGEFVSDHQVNIGDYIALASVHISALQTKIGLIHDYRDSLAIENGQRAILRGHILEHVAFVREAQRQLLAWHQSQLLYVDFVCFNDSAGNFFGCLMYDDGPPDIGHLDVQFESGRTLAVDGLYPNSSTTFTCRPGAAEIEDRCTSLSNVEPFFAKSRRDYVKAKNLPARYHGEVGVYANLWELLIPAGPVGFVDDANPVAEFSNGIGGVIALDAGESFSGGGGCVILADDSAVSCWGAEEGFIPPDSVNGVDGGATHISIGPYRSCAVQAETGNVVCWGSSSIAPNVTEVPPIVNDGNAFEVYVSTGMACALLQAGNAIGGAVVCWGGTDGSELPVPDVFNDTNGYALALDVGYDRACAIPSEGRQNVYCWGPDGILFAQAMPKELREVSTSFDHFCAIEEESRRVVCGGDDFIGETMVPEDLGPVIDLSTAPLGTCAIRQYDREIICWGLTLYDFDLAQYRTVTGTARTIVRTGVGAVGLAIYEQNPAAVTLAESLVVTAPLEAPGVSPGDDFINSGDSDGDGLSNLLEREWGTHQYGSDFDNDGLADGAEYFRFTTATDGVELAVPDGVSGVRSDPREPDSDGDGLLDGAEVALMTDPMDPDSDDDGIGDAEDQCQGTPVGRAVDENGCALPTTDGIIESVYEFRDSGEIKRQLVSALLSKLINAARKFDQGRCRPAGNQYGAFINQVRAQTGKGITPSAAEVLIAEAEYLISDCSAGTAVAGHDRRARVDTRRREVQSGPTEHVPNANRGRRTARKLESSKRK